MSTGVFFPSLASLCSQRVVEGERGFLMSIMSSGSHLGYVVQTHIHNNTGVIVCDTLFLSVQNIVSRWHGVSVDGQVRLGKHVLRSWIPVRTLGTHCLAVFTKRYSNHTLVNWGVRVERRPSLTLPLHTACEATWVTRFCWCLISLSFTLVQTEIAQQL